MEDKNNAIDADIQDEKNVAEDTCVLRNAEKKLPVPKENINDKRKELTKPTMEKLKLMRILLRMQKLKLKRTIWLMKKFKLMRIMAKMQKF